MGSHIKFEYAGQRDDSLPGRLERDGDIFYHATQKGTQYKTYDFFIYIILHLIILGPG